MKKTLFFAAITSAFICTSCSDDVENTIINDTKVDMTFTIASSGSDATRAHITDYKIETGSPGVTWDEGDKVTIFEKTHYTSGDPLTCQKVTGYGNSGTFTGKSYKGSDYIAVYPSTTNAVVNSDFEKVTFTIPDKQTAIKGTFDPKAAIQLGKSQGTGAIDLNHVTAAFFIELENNCTCTAVSVQSGTEGWAMAGTVTAKIGSEGNEIDASTISGSEKIVLSGMPAKTAGVYMMSFIPSNATPNFTLTISYDNEAGVHKTYTRTFRAKETSFQFIVGNMYSLGKYGMGEDGTLVKKD